MSTEYRKLRKVWYKRLADEAKAAEDANLEPIYKDIETLGGDLVGGTTNWKFNSARNRQCALGKNEYFYAAFQFLHSHKFESEVHKVIWEYHCEGISVAKIAELLKAAGVTKAYKNHSKPISRPRVWQIVAKYRKVLMHERF